MQTLTNKKEWTLTSLDRCDACAAQAYVHVKGVSGELMFCGHHYEKAISTPAGYDSMMKFGFEFIDERERLIENRLVGSEN
jgi:hypothetical protein